MERVKEVGRGRGRTNFGNKNHHFRNQKDKLSLSKSNGQILESKKSCQKSNRQYQRIKTNDYFSDIPQQSRSLHLHLFFRENNSIAALEYDDSN